VTVISGTTDARVIITPARCHALVGDGPHYLVTGADAEAVQELMEGAQLSRSGCGNRGRNPHAETQLDRQPDSGQRLGPAPLPAMLHRSAPASPNRG
jgi:hypothetical protein